MNETSLRAIGRGGVDLRPQPREAHDVEVAAEGPRQPIGELLSLDRGQEADGAEVDPEHRHTGARIAAERAEHRAVPAEHQAEVGVLREVFADLDPAGGLAVLLELVGGRRQRTGDALSGSDRLAQRGRGLLRMGVGENDRGAHRGGGLRACAHGSTSRAAASRSSTPAPSAPHQMKLSRLPFGPGSPDEAKPRTARPSPRAASADGHQRLAPIVRRAHHPAPGPPPPELELGLDQGQDLAAGRQTAGHRGQHLGQRDEGDVDRRQAGLVREVGGRQLARVLPLDHLHPGIVAKAPLELPVADVEGDHAPRAALEQAVGEAARGGADVEAKTARLPRSRGRRGRARA